MWDLKPCILYVVIFNDWNEKNTDLNCSRDGLEWDTPQYQYLLPTLRLSNWLLIAQHWLGSLCHKPGFDFMSAWFFTLHDSLNSKMRISTLLCAFPPPGLWLTSVHLSPFIVIHESLSRKSQFQYGRQYR